MNSEDTYVFTERRTIRAANLRAIAASLKLNSIPHRAEWVQKYSWQAQMKTGEVYLWVKPVHAELADKIIKRLDME